MNPKKTTGFTVFIVVLELICWTVFCLFLAMTQTCPLLLPFREWCNEGLLFKNLWPQSNHEGWGGLSFISVATGLNLALVKLEAFIKSLESVKTEWIKGVEKQLIGEEFAGALADENTAQQAQDVLRKHCTKLIEKINEENARLWNICRGFAKRCTYAGFGFLFFQYSAGFLAPILLFPALGAYGARVFCTRKLFDKVDGGIDMKRELITLALANSKAGEEKIDKSLQTLLNDTPGKKPTRRSRRTQEGLGEG
jgi:hypothetical protein